MRRFSRFPILLAAVVVSLGLCASAQAAIVMVGSPLTGPYFSTLTCGNPLGCTWSNTALAESGANVTSPVSGAIVRWRLAGNYSGAFTLRVLRPAGGGQYTGAGSSMPVNATGTATVTFPADLPIQAGDLIAVDYENGRHLATASVAGSAFSLWTPSLGAFATGAPSSISPNLEILFNADVQPVPQIAALSPPNGSIAGGTRVVIVGHDLNEASSVSFGSVPAASFTVNSESEIVAVSPPASAPGAVDVTVTTVAGTTATSSADRFSYRACVVPKLAGRKLNASKKMLRHADCTIGKVKKTNGATAKTGRVVKQHPKPGEVLVPGTRVKVTLNP